VLHIHFRAEHALPRFGEQQRPNVFVQWPPVDGPCRVGHGLFLPNETSQQGCPVLGKARIVRAREVDKLEKELGKVQSTVQRYRELEIQVPDNEKE
jgi:hypothetical protein